MAIIPKLKKDADAAAAAPAAAAPAAAAPAAAAPAAAPTATNTAGPAADTTTAVATRPAGAVVVAGRPVNVVEQTYKNAFVVDWNTCHRLQATNGNIVDMEANKTPLGPSILLEIMSYQDNWQISPGTDNKEDAELVRYSNDGITTTEGENCIEYVEALKASGRTDAKMTHRCTVAGTIQGTPLDGKLVQIDLPQTSKNMWDRFQMQSAMDIAKGKRTAADLAVLRLHCTLVTKGNNTWTVVNFDYAS